MPGGICVITSTAGLFAEQPEPTRAVAVLLIMVAVSACTTTTWVIVMGLSKDKLDFDQTVEEDWAIFMPDEYWHHVINQGSAPLKVDVIDSPPEHPSGTAHQTFADAESDHKH